MSKIELSINVNYLPKWGLWEGIRELVQNGKDAETEHNATLNITHIGSTISIVNEGVTLSKEALLFGTTSKAERKDTIGRFGEGLKLGVLALVRNGAPVVIKTGDEIWTPSVERSDKYDADVLVINVRKTPKYRNYVQVTIDGFDDETWELFRKRFIFLQDISPAEKVATMRGTLLIGTRFEGHIYVKGIYVVTDKSLKYGYDFLYATIDRDRKMISSWDMQTESAMIWGEACTLRQDLTDPFYELVAANSADVAHLEYLSGQLADKVPQATLATFRSKHGPLAVPVANLAESSDVEHLGKRGVVVSRALGAILAQTLGSVENVMKTLRDEVTHYFSWFDLTQVEGENLSTMVRLIARERPDMNLGLVDVVEFRSKTLLGQYKDGRILISKHLLVDKGELLATLIHEICHRHGLDGEKGHITAVENLWRDVIKSMNGWL